MKAKATRKEELAAKIITTLSKHSAFTVDSFVAVAAKKTLLSLPSYQISNLYAMIVLGDMDRVIDLM